VEDLLQKLLKLCVRFAREDTVGCERRAPHAAVTCPSRFFRRSPARGALLLLAAAATGCAPPPVRLPDRSPAPGAHLLRADRPVTLLGEVHDNAAGHALRLRAFDALLAGGARPALVMEQFDLGEQAAIDSALKRSPPPTATELVAAVQAARPGASAGTASTATWQWAFYEPFIERALRHGLPIVAANVGREEARRVIREGLAARGFVAVVPEDILAGQAAAIEASHCGQVDASLARRMALAQVARDQQMARAVSAHAARGALLLAGNGHVRNDLGVPRWLDDATRRRTLSVGVLEPGDAAHAFDTHAIVAAQPRPDPCASMRAPQSPSRPASAGG